MSHYSLMLMPDMHAGHQKHMTTLCTSTTVTSGLAGYNMKQGTSPATYSALPHSNVNPHQPNALPSQEMMLVLSGNFEAMDEPNRSTSTEQAACLINPDYNTMHVVLFIRPLSIPCIVHFDPRRHARWALLHDEAGQVYKPVLCRATQALGQE